MCRLLQPPCPPLPGQLLPRLKPTTGRTYAHTSTARVALALERTSSQEADSEVTTLLCWLVKLSLDGRAKRVATTSLLLDNPALILKPADTTLRLSGLRPLKSAAPTLSAAQTLLGVRCILLGPLWCATTKDQATTSDRLLTFHAPLATVALLPLLLPQPRPLDHQFHLLRLLLPHRLLRRPRQVVPLPSLV